MVKILEKQEVLALLFLYCYLSILELTEKGWRNGLTTAQHGQEELIFCLIAQSYKNE